MEIPMMKFACPFVFAALLAPANAALAQTANPADISLVSISLTNYAFTPNAITLKAGTAYRLHFINSGSKDHNFSAPEFFAASAVAAEDEAKVKKGLVDMKSGQSIDVTVTPSRAGTYPVECTHFMHEAMGMHASITVE
jgi:plastocyanin